MNGINKMICIGNLGKDPEVRYSEGGNAMANFSIAVSESWKDNQTGEKREKTEWIRIVAFGKLAEIIGKYLKKGSKVYIEGKLQTRKWQGNDGQDRYTTEVVARDMQMLGDRPQQTTNVQQDTAQADLGASEPELNDPLPSVLGGADEDEDESVPF